MNLKNSSLSWFKVLRRQPRRGGSDFVAPRRDWLWTLALAVIILLLGVAGLAYHFSTIQTTATQEIDVATTLIRYRQVDVNHFLAEMDARSKAHAALRAVSYIQKRPTPTATTTPALPETAPSPSAVEEAGAL